MAVSVLGLAGRAAKIRAASGLSGRIAHRMGWRNGNLVPTRLDRPIAGLPCSRRGLFYGGVGARQAPQLALRLGQHNSPLGGNAAPLGGPSDFRGRGWLDACGTPGTLQCKQGALGIDASRDPAPIRQFDRPLEDPASTSIHLLRRSADVVDIEVMQPARLRYTRKFCEHAADGLPTCRKQLIQVRWIGLSVGLLPTEQLSVEIEDHGPVGGHELMPAYAPRLVRPTGFRSAICRCFDQP